MRRVPVSSASLLFQAKHQPCSSCSTHAWILSGREKSLSLLTPFLPKELLPCIANPLEKGWQRRSSSGHLHWQLNVTHFELGASLRSEGNQLLTKHHSRWGCVHSIGEQHLQVQLLEFISRSLSLSGQKGPFQGPNLFLTAMPEPPCPPPPAKNTLAWWWLFADCMGQNGTASPLHYNSPPQVGTGSGLYLYYQIIIVSNNKNLKYQPRTRAQAKEVFTSLRTNVWEELKHNSTNWKIIKKKKIISVLELFGMRKTAYQSICMLQQCNFLRKGYFIKQNKKKS